MVGVFYLGCAGSHFSSLGVLSLPEQHVEAPHEQLLCSCEVAPDGYLKRKLGIFERVGDVRHDVVLINADR